MVRFRVHPRGRQTLRARLFGPRPLSLLQDRSPLQARNPLHARNPLQARNPRGSHDKGRRPKRQHAKSPRPRQTAPHDLLTHDHPPMTSTALSPAHLARSSRRPRLATEGATNPTPIPNDSQSPQSFTMRALTMEKVGREVEEHTVGKSHRLATPRSDCSRSQHRLDFTEAGEMVRLGVRLGEMRLQGDTDAVAEMLLDEAVSLSLEPPVAVNADDELVTADAKDALAQDTKDAVAAEPEQPAGQANVHCA